MKKNKLLCLAIVLLTSSIGFAQWVSLDKNSPPDSKPVVQLISDDINATVIKVDLPGFRIKEFSADGKIYNKIDLGLSGIISEAGMPDIPYIAKVLAIPDQGTVSVEVIEISNSQIIKDINIPPARKSWMEGEPETPYLVNEAIYSSADLYPPQFARVEDPVIFRDFRLTRVSIFPIRYSPAKHVIEAVTSITVKIKYGGGTGINPKFTSKKPLAPSFARLYKSVIFNYNEVLQREYDGRVDGYDFMLCIMPDSFVTSFQPYAEWNHKTGTYIHVTKFSDIGASGSNPTAVKNHILDAYNNWPVRPTHILLIGDAGVAPHQTITMDGWTFPYDDYFVELVGNDYFPEMMIGRFTNQANPKLRGIRNKLINYEKIPYTADPNWFRKGLVCANDAYPSQRETKSFTRYEMLYRGNFISVDSLFDGYPCPGSNATISNMINSGRGWLNYRGEGWYTQWWTDCFPFSTTEINALANGQKLTFVTSIGCGVANWTAAGNNCFGEAWMEIADENNPRGACGFLGPTSNTHTAYNNNIDIGIYVGMFEEGLDSPGEALLRGKFYMYQVFGGADYYVGYHYRIYHVLGDPSLHIWKDTPRNINVTYTDTIGVGSSQVQVLVTESGTGAPVADALICISGNGIYVTGTTLANGTAILDVTTSSTGQLDFTVSGGRSIPFEGYIQVVESVNTFQLSVQINNGWNMVSIPGLHPVDQNVNTWWQYRDNSAPVYEFLPPYSPVSTVIPGKGYWMKHSGARMYNTGEEWPAGGILIVNHNPLSVSAGWNLIGGYENIVATADLTTTPPGLISGPLYKYLSGYQIAATLDPGFGYWVKLNGAGLINFPGGINKEIERVEYFKDDWGRIIISDNSGKTMVLYAVNGEVNLDQYELPPIPPSGMFDIRFGSGRIAEILDNTFQPVELRSVEYPVTIRTENINIKLQDETGKILNTILKSGEEFIVRDASINKLMVTGEIIPVEYSLEQNYPNPFNPVTTIEFSLPEDVSSLKLSVYNALGEKVAELVNQSLPAGRYSYQWNANNAASGMYIYELKTENFASIKKMLLLK